MQENNNTELTVSNEVIEKIAEIAAKEVDGVADLTKKAVDIKNLNYFNKAVKVMQVDGTISLDVYVTLKKDAKLRETVSTVQENVKDKIQTNTGIAVTKVNIIVADISEEADN